MNYLLDTHVLIWTIAEPDKLSKNVRAAIESPENIIFVSAITFWEISLKYALGKLTLEGILPHDLPLVCEQLQFEELSLEADISSTYHLLTADYHKDPFDRMLIWQAINHRLTLISNDEKIGMYRSEGLNVLWE